MTKVVPNSSLNPLGIWPVLISEKSFSPRYFGQINSENYFCFSLPHFFGEYPHLGWVAIDKKYQKVPRASWSTFTNFKFWSPNFHLQKCLETAGETVKLFPSTVSNPKKWRKTTFRKCSKGNVALSLCIFRSLCSLVTHSAQYCDISTVFHDILHDWQQSSYIHQRDSTFC